MATGTKVYVPDEMIEEIKRMIEEHQRRVYEALNRRKPGRKSHRDF